MKKVNYDYNGILMNWAIGHKDGRWSLIQTNEMCCILIGCTRVTYALNGTAMGIVGDQRDLGMQCTYFHEGSYFDSEGAEEGI